MLRSFMANIVFGWSPDVHSGDKEIDYNPKEYQCSFLSDPITASEMKEVFTSEKLDQLSNDALVKICRQLEFWFKEGKLGPEDMKNLAKSLVDQSLWYRPLILPDKNESHSNNDNVKDLESFKVPKRRFGKTELQMPIVTCGGMRLQYTWMSDDLPFSPNRKKVLGGFSQENLKRCIQSCLALGLNHFETARMYGTSEFQMVEAIHELMQEGTIKREDFIFQTKIVPGTTKDFLKLWKSSWENVGEKLGYIDLLGIHCLADINPELDQTLEICDRLKKEGKIHHLGFSTHGCSEQIMNIINTEKFDYINIHEHFFGSYHGSGTPNSLGGQGNSACVKRALELDMGVFQISPLDKGGKLYRPSKDCALAIGKDITPGAFALCHGWKNIGFHTSSIGIARLSDLDEVLGATKLMILEEKGEIDLDQLLDDAINRLESRAQDILGEEWMEKGLLNLPSMMEEVTDGVAIGHILWIYNLLVCYGMYEFCHDRYGWLVSTGKNWKKNKAFDENAATMVRSNLGRAYDKSVDLTKALEKHYNPSLALERIQQTHEWLSTDKYLTDAEIEAKGWKKGYNLTVWTEIPGELDATVMSKLMQQIVTGGRMGITGTGPGFQVKTESSLLRNFFLN